MIHMNLITNAPMIQINNLQLQVYLLKAHISLLDHCIIAHALSE